MPRKPLGSKEKRLAVITGYVTHDERQAITEASRKAGYQSLSDFIRDAVLSKISTNPDNLPSFETWAEARLAAVGRYPTQAETDRAENKEWTTWGS